jgi:hypothetical protein
MVVAIPGFFENLDIVTIFAINLWIMILVCSILTPTFFFLYRYRYDNVKTELERLKKIEIERKNENNKNSNLKSI